ncbi:site-specific integrase [Streptomyces hoynatensis]|uniref:Site-specific integrase n=1 Tax=Streptomyces hoynatensis TaxID=1141874 RepID=A0A3A9YUJ8_9ACTN|nr:site-specific integrase [Streptomyces hoynatensis]RKN39743.1 site-specific integrase [Streptomyces hoynatensis]
MTITAESISADRFEALLADASIPVVHRALWLMLWETDVRVLDLLALEVPDVDLTARRIRPGTAEGAADLGERATALLAELVGARTSGPLFAVGSPALRALPWEQTVRVAEEHGIAAHAFRASGRSHRRAEGGDAAPAPA